MHTWCGNSAHMDTWCTHGVQLVHSWCAVDARMMYGSCTDGVQMVCRRLFTVGAHMVCRKCTVGLQLMGGSCTDDAQTVLRVQMMCRWCADDYSQLLHRWRTDLGHAPYCWLSTRCSIHMLDSIWWQAQDMWGGVRSRAACGSMCGAACDRM